MAELDEQILEKEKRVDIGSIDKEDFKEESIQGTIHVFNSST